MNDDDRYVGNRWELIDHACRLAEERRDEEVPRDAFGNFDPPDELLNHLDERR